MLMLHLQFGAQCVAQRHPKLLFTQRLFGVIFLFIFSFHFSFHFFVIFLFFQDWAICMS